MSLDQHPPDLIELIIDENVEKIESDLRNSGLSYDSLIEDLLDHICCLVELEMESGKDFDTSYSDVIDSIGENRLPEIQYQTLLLLDKKFQRMKKVTYVIGLIASFIVLFGTLSKRMHWPGAGIELSLGLLAIVLVFLPLYFIVASREMEEKRSIIYPIIGYLTVASLLTGAIFKIQHWPGAELVLIIGMAVLLIGFVPLYIVNAFQKAKGEKVGLPYIIMVIVGVAIMSLTSSVRMAKDKLESYRAEAILNETRITEIEGRTASLLSGLNEDSSANINTIHSKALELQLMIDEMLEEMLVTIKEPGISLETLQKLDKTGVGRDVILDNGWARKFMNLSWDYHKLLMEMIDDPVVCNQIDDHLEYAGDAWFNDWGPEEVMYDPVIKIYYKHTDVSKGIALSEYVAIDYLKDLE